MTKKVLDAIKTINKAILDMNDGDTSRENFYWWNAVLETFDLMVDRDSGKIVRENGEEV